MNELRCCYDGVSECIIGKVAVQRVEPRLLDGAELSSYQWCNTNNHRDTDRYVELTAQGGDWYRSTQEETRMEKWAAVLGDLCGNRLLDVCKLIISASQQRRYFKPASQLALVGARASSLLKEEAEDLEEELMASCGKSLEPPVGGWFVRTSACSPKDAWHDGGAGPHQSLQKVLLALLASDRIHRSMQAEGYDVDTIVYLMPFDAKVSIGRELRVFVHERQVTAMSQYDVHSTSEIFAQMDNECLAAVAHCVDAFHRELLSPRWEAAGGIASYIMDVEYIENENGDENDDTKMRMGPQVRLIELNSFGAEQAAGSALFHWLRDSAELYSSDRLSIRIRSGGQRC